MSRIILLSFFLFFGSSSSSSSSSSADDGEMLEGSGCFATDREDQGRDFSQLKLNVGYSSLLFSGESCVFPFSDEEGSLHYICTRAGDPYGEEWCATQTDQEHSVIQWGHCSPGCGDIEDRGQTNIKY